MPLITPSDGTYVELKDHEPYRVHLAELPKLTTGSAEFGGQPRLEFSWQLNDGEPDDTIKDWVGLKLGQNSSGEVSKLRQLLNVLVGKHESTPIAWFNSDLDKLEWSYDGISPHMKLTEGLAVIIRGKNKPKKGAVVDPATGLIPTRYRIENYEGMPVAAAAPPPPPAGATNGFLQISPDGKYGWNGSAWVEIQAAIPPPPPAAAIPPPPGATPKPTRRAPAPATAAASAAQPDGVNPDEIPY